MSFLEHVNDNSLENAYAVAERSGHLDYLCQMNCSVPLPPFPANIKVLKLQSGVESIPELPAGLEELEVNMPSLKRLPALPESLRCLSVSSKDLEELPTLPVSLELLICKHSQFAEFPTLPASLKTFIVDNMHTALPALPEGLEVFNVARCNVDSLPMLPASLSRLTLSHMPNVRALPVLPQGLVSLICWDMGIEILPRLPVSLQVASSAYNNYNEEFRAIERMHEVSGNDDWVGDDEETQLTAEQIAAVNAYHDRLEARAEARSCGRDLLTLSTTVGRRPDVSEELSAHMGSFLSGLLTRMDVQRAFLQLNAQ